MSDPESGPDSGAAVKAGAPPPLLAGEAPAPRRRGRPKGSRNKATREIRELAQKYTKGALRRLKKLSESDDQQIALAACKEILDRGHGKPVATSEVTGKDGSALGVSAIAFLASLPE